MFKGNVLRFFLFSRFLPVICSLSNVRIYTYMVNDAYLLSAVALFRDIIIVIDDDVASMVCNTHIV
jgi:hypothetical protein